MSLATEPVIPSEVPMLFLGTESTNLSSIFLVLGVQLR